MILHPSFFKATKDKQVKKEVKYITQIPTPEGHLLPGLSEQPPIEKVIKELENNLLLLQRENDVLRQGQKVVIQAFEKADNKNRELSAEILHLKYKLKEKSDLALLVGENDGTLALVKECRSEEENRHAVSKDRKNEVLYRTLTQNFPHGTIEVFDRESTYMFIGGKELEVLGLKAEEMVGKTLFDFFERDTALKIRHYHQKTFEGTSTSFEFTFQDRFYEAHTIPLPEEDGRINNIMSVVENITMRKMADKKLIASYKSLADLKNALDIASLVCILDSEGRFTYANYNLCQKSGYTFNELIGQHYSKLNSGTFHASLFFKRIASSARKGKYWKGESRIIAKDESYCWLETSLVPFMGNNNEPVQYLCISYDISERKIAEKKIKENQKRLQEAQRIAKMGSWQIVVGSKEIQWSEETYNILGFDHKQPIPALECIWQRICPKDHRRLEKAIANIVSKATPFSIDICVIGEGVEMKYVHVIGKPILNQHKKIVAISGTLTDITDRKHTESMLKEQNEQLKKINSELDEFVYSASHDLRAPLVSVLGLINIMKLEKGENIDQYLEMMRKSIYKLDKYVQDITDYSRNARVDLHYGDINFIEQVSETLDGLRYMQHAEKVKTTVDVTQSVPFTTDSRRLSIILSNLVSNALKYSIDQNEKPKIAIKVSVCEAKAVIYIKDNGQGIDAEHHEKIYDMFYRATDKSNGSGLGLYIVKETLQKLDGSIQVKSAPGKGCCFMVTIPNSFK